MIINILGILGLVTFQQNNKSMHKFHYYPFIKISHFINITHTQKFKFYFYIYSYSLKLEKKYTFNTNL